MSINPKMDFAGISFTTTDRKTYQYVNSASDARTVVNIDYNKINAPPATRWQQSAQPQSMTVTGTVTDNTEPLPGVSVEVKGTTIFTVTGIDGRYYINIPNDDAILVFTFVGFETKEIAVGSNRVFDIKLTPSRNRKQRTKR
jgi:hypothetical protein